MSSINNIKSLEKQTLLDIAVQQLGNVDDVFLIIAQNDVDFSEQLPAGTVIDINGIVPIQKEIVNYYLENNIIPATDLTQKEFNEIEEPMYIPELTFKTVRFRADKGGDVNIPDSLHSKWQSADKRFLDCNPEIWMFIEKRRARKILAGRIVKKSFGHPPHENGIKYPNSAYYAGSSENGFGVNYQTEFSLSNVSGDYIHLPINVLDYFKAEYGYTWGAIDEDSELDSLRIRTILTGASRAIAMRFAIVIDNPDNSSKYPKLYGAMSKTVSLTADYQDVKRYFTFKLTDK